MKIRQARKIVSKCSLVKTEDGAVGLESNGQRTRSMRLAVGLVLRHHRQFNKKLWTPACVLDLWLGDRTLSVSRSKKKHKAVFDLRNFGRKRI